MESLWSWYTRTHKDVKRDGFIVYGRSFSLQSEDDTDDSAHYETTICYWMYSMQVLCTWDSGYLKSVTEGKWQKNIL